MPFTSINFALFTSIFLVLISNTFNTMEMVASVCTAFGYGYCSVSAFHQARKQRDFRYMLTGAAGAAVCAVWFVLLLIPFLGTGVVADWKMYFSLASWIFIGIVGYSITSRDIDELFDIETLWQNGREA